MKTNRHQNRIIRANSRNSRIEPGRSLSANCANFRESNGRSRGRQSALAFLKEEVRRLTSAATPFVERRCVAFTLLELLVVIGIIALITAIAVPAFNGMRPNLLAVASRQMLDDLNWARQRAISDHTTVYVVFIPEIAAYVAGTPPANLPGGDKQRILQGQYTGYAFYVKRQLGDQPGNPTVRYLTGWKTLPQGTAFAQQKFVGNPANPTQFTANYAPTLVTANGSNVCWTFDVTSVQWNPEVNPVPNPDNAYFPYISFDYRGSLSSSWHTDGAKAGHCVIPLTKAIVSVAKDAADPTRQTLAWSGVTYAENPTGTWIDPTLHTYIVIDGPTGKAHVEHAQVQ